MTSKSPSCFVLALIIFTAPVFANDPRFRSFGDTQSATNTGREIEGYVFSSRKGEVKTSIQCLDGYKFAVVSAIGHNTAPEPAATIIQVHEDIKGRIVPAKC